MRVNKLYNIFMDKAEQIEDSYERLRIVRTWEKRIEMLKKKGMKQVVFCRNHGISPVFLVRAKKLNNIPIWKNIHVVEKALKAEGV